MAFLGKEYKFVKEENTAGLIDSFEISEERKEKWRTTKSPKTISKNADGTYSLASSSSSGPIAFKSGEEFELKFPELTTKFTITIDGNTVTQQTKYNDKTVKTIMQFTDNELVETITASNWDGVAKVYYKA